MTKNFLIALTMTAMASLIGLEFAGNTYLLPLVVLGPVYLVTRGVIFGLLAALLIWTPPRSQEFRYGLGVASLLSGASALWLVASFSVNFIDMVLFALVSIIFAIEALELESVSKPAEKTATSS